MHQLQRSRVQQMQVDARLARVVHLTEETAEVRAALMPHPCVGQQAHTRTGLLQTVAEINVLAEAHPSEAAQFMPQPAPHTHIVRAGIEAVELLLATAYAARSEERRHGIADSFLQRSEVGVRAVRTAEGIARGARKLFLNGCEEAHWQHHVGVEHYKIVARGTLRAVVARCTRTAILFHVVMNVQAVSKMLARLAACHLAAVLHDMDVEIAERLLRQALQQLRHLVGAVIYRHYNTILHALSHLSFRLQR